MQPYLVGGAVRDALLGLPKKDRDWVVVGATVTQMLAQGYKPVGKDFPVFLHPETHEEYALARTERKSGVGYKGFTVFADASVTLEQDLERRDLSINAMAREATGNIIDPFGGQADLRAKVLRHVSPAFAEDPLRVLRVARFAAQLEGFTVAPETLQLMQQLTPELQHLTPERVWQELSKGLMTAAPWRMFEVLNDCGALAALLPELAALQGVPQPAAHHPEIDTFVHVIMVLKMAVRMQLSLAERFACLVHDLGKGTTPADILPRHIGHDQRGVALVQAVCQRFRVPNDAAQLAELVCREHINIHQSEAFGAAAILRLLVRCDGIRRPERFAQILHCCEADARGRLGFEARDYPAAARLLKCLSTALSLDMKALLTHTDKANIATQVKAIRTRAIATYLQADTC